MDGEQLAAAFLAGLAGGSRDVGAELAAELSDLIARARTEAPSVHIDPAAFARYVGERATFDRDGKAVLAPLRAGALWIACGCVAGEPTAVVEFERTYAGEIRDALARNFEHAMVEEAELRLRDRLMLVEGDDVPRLASYAGRGDLRAWLRAAAIRTAIDLMRARREIAADPAALDDAAAASDPMLAALKLRYRDEFRAAFTDALTTLTDRDRTLLRYAFVEELSIDEVATIYRVHRATAARWIAAIRESLFDVTRTRLMAKLDLSPTEADSLIRLIDSQLDVSVSAAFRVTPPRA